MIVRLSTLTNLFLIDGIPRGLKNFGLPAIGINIYLTPIQDKFFFSTASISSNIFLFVNATMISLFGPFVLAPFFSFR